MALESIGPSRDGPSHMAILDNSGGQIVFPVLDTKSRKKQAGNVHA